MRKARLLNAVRGPGSILMGLLLAAACGPLRASLAPAVSRADRLTDGRAGLEGVKPHAASRAPAEAATRARVSKAFGKVPLHFEANRAQTDPRVQFLARGGGYTLFLTPTETVLVLTRTVVRMTALGANPEPRASGQAELPGKANYFRGNDRRKWDTNVPTYARVRYQDLYPGIDLIYYGTQGQLEYDFVLAPGADAGQVVLRFEGADKIEVDGHGDLVLQTATGALRQRKPVLYQEGADGRRAVAGGYVLKGADRVGFQVGGYDRSRPLVIDPVLVYSTYLGGSGDDFFGRIAVDDSGSAYVTGGTRSADFPTTPGTVQAALRGTLDAFVTKLDPTGTAIVYSTYLGGSGDRFGTGDAGSGIAVDSDGNAYVTGGTFSADFPTTPGAFQTTLGGLSDAFVTKLDPTGSALVYSTYLGGRANTVSTGEGGSGIAVDVDGNAYVTGTTENGDFPTTPGAFQPASCPPQCSTSFNAFVTKLDPTGTALVYSTLLGGTFSDDRSSAIAIDCAGHAYVTGRTRFGGFPTTPGAFQTAPVRQVPAGEFDAFVTKLEPDGTALVYSTYLSGSGADAGNAIATDDAGHAYVTGSTSPSLSFPGLPPPIAFPTTPGAFQTVPSRGDAFVTKLEPDGTALVYSTYLGGSDGEVGAGIAVDGAGHAYVTGGTSSVDFPTTPEAFQTALQGSSDAFVTELGPTGEALVFSTYLGGSGSDAGSDIALDGGGNAYVAGVTVSADFPTTPGAFQPALAGARDGFVAKIGEDDDCDLQDLPLPVCEFVLPGSPLGNARHPRCAPCRP